MHRASALRLSSLAALFLMLCQATLPAHGATYTIALQTGAPSYSGLAPISITGTISPAPGTDTGVIITIEDQAGTIADIMEVVPSSTDGSFSYTSHPGGNAAWTSGTFTVNATWGGDGTSASKVVTFAYTAAATSSTSSSTSSTSSTSESSSTTSSTSTSTSGSSSASSETTSSTTSAPEFPSGALAVTALIGVALVAVLSRAGVGRAGGGSRLANAVKTD